MAKKKRRLYRSILGIPIWLILGLSLFILFSAIYDFVVGDRNAVRYLLIFGSMAILVISIILHFVPVKTVGSIAKKQMGG